MTEQTEPAPAHPFVLSVTAWLRGSRLGLVVLAIAVGLVAGFGAAGFRWLIFEITWLLTGHQQFGSQGRIPSTHVPGLGIWFLLAVPVLGGLIYGPLIQRFAKEARGHGVPEVMLAVAEDGGRIRPPVTAVKAVASAVCIGAGGSVGREGPIVQIGSAAASTMGQLVRMSESRLRIIVACGAAGGIAATFNAPITGLFFGFEIILREFSLDALFATMLSAVTADLVSRSLFGSGPFFAGMPHNLVIEHPYTYLLVALVGLLAGVVGFGFKTVLYKFEDVMDRVWRGRPEWARPVVGGVALGGLLLLLPQMYGVGYPVMDQAVSGHVVLWLLAILMIGKIVASSLTLSIGGSGGIFAPSLFTGAMAGMTFGLIVRDLFGPIVSSPAVFAVVAMGAVFGAAAQSPLTAIASVVEMTGNYTLIVPVMLAVGIAVAVSKRLSYGSIYTTKLLRRGIDIERPRPSHVLQAMTVADAMVPISGHDGRAPAEVHHASPRDATEQLASIGPVVERSEPQVLFADESLEQALRQLALYGRAGLPVLSEDDEHPLGWITLHDVVGVLEDSVDTEADQAARGQLATEFADRKATANLHVPRTPLRGYETIEVVIPASSSVVGRRPAELPRPKGSFVVAVVGDGDHVRSSNGSVLRAGDRVVYLVPTEGDGSRRAEEL